MMGAEAASDMDTKFSFAWLIPENAWLYLLTFKASNPETALLYILRLGFF
jgi:hypothetical protein